MDLKEKFLTMISLLLKQNRTGRKEDRLTDNKDHDSVHLLVPTSAKPWDHRNKATRPGAREAPTQDALLPTQIWPPPQTHSRNAGEVTSAMP